MLPSLAEYDPTTYVWSLYFLAQHHSYVSPTNPETALHFIDTALEHTPTLPELYMIKARILKRCGDPIGASQAMEDARMLDLQDRFLNTKSAKYLLRDGQIEQANSVLGLFTKVSATRTFLYYIFYPFLLDLERCSQPGGRPGRDAVSTIPLRRRPCISRRRKAFACSEAVSSGRKGI